MLSRVFEGAIVLPQFFTIGPLIIHYYGLIMAGAVLAGYLLARKNAKNFGIEPKTADDLIFWTIVGGFIGARLYHVLSSYHYYVQHPINILRVWNGGLSIYGAILGGIITIWIYRLLSTKHLALSTILDWLALSVLLGQIIGRFGNLFNYEAFGYPTSLPWKMFVPADFRPLDLLPHQFFHPLFLYEALGNIFILMILLKMVKKQLPGALFFSYLLLYNVLRIFLEFMRVDSTFIGNFRLNVVSSLALIILSLAALSVIKFKKTQKFKI